MAGAIIAPGNSPGADLEGDLRLDPGARLRMEVLGGMPGSEHDIIKVIGDADLGGRSGPYANNFRSRIFLSSA
jgi:hypothetical protein